MDSGIEQKYIIEIRNVHVGLCAWLEGIIKFANGGILKKEWQSLYNHYVCYDYKPFGEDGFKNNYLVEFPSENHCKFVMSEYKKHLDNIVFLAGCYFLNNKEEKPMAVTQWAGRAKRGRKEVKK